MLGTVLLGKTVLGAQPSWVVLAASVLLGAVSYSASLWLFAPDLVWRIYEAFAGLLRSRRHPIVG